MSETGAVASWIPLRHIYSSSDKTHRFSAGGLIDQQNGVIADTKALHRLMVILSRCIDNASRTSADDNPNLPAGYSYLLQFIAHDMTDSVSSLTIADGILRPAGLNARQRSLVLETLYGGGPDSHAHAYAASKDTLVSNVGVRTHLRVGKRRAPQQGSKTSLCPYRDVARGQAPIDDPAEAQGVYTEAYLVDRRNDSHAFVSQLTILFQLLHNSIVDRLPTCGPNEPGLQDTQRRFLCARAMLTLIYRQIVLEDVLPRIIDPAILQRYRNEDKPLFDDDPSVPVEFTHAAFRFAHSMVRDEYDVRGDGPQDTFRALQFSSVLAPKSLRVPPPRQTWFVDWARFFSTPLSPARLNLAKCIGPHYAHALGGGLFPRKTSDDWPGLASRDLLSACFNWMLSAPAVSAKFQTVFGATRVCDFDDWKAPLREWLTAHWPGTPDATDLDRLVNDPPLSFFVMFEAAQANEGKTLGPVGSIIVAETFYGILKGQPADFELSSATLGGRLEACAVAMFPKQATRAREVAAELAGITSMPTLLAHLAALGHLENVTSAM